MTGPLDEVAADFAGAPVFVPRLTLDDSSFTAATGRDRTARKRRRSTGTAPVASVAAAPRKPRSRARTVASMTAMSFVAAIAISTSLPSMALLSESDVAAASVAASAVVSTPRSTADVQSFTAGAAVEAPVQRDSYGVETRKTQTNVAAIGRTSTAFTNNQNGTIQWPFAVGVPVGDRFGFRDCAGCSSNHGGTDFNPGNGSPTQAIADGVVRFVEDGEGSLGAHVIIDHEINGELVSSVYAHFQHGSIAVKQGDPVKVGQLVGLVGSTGMSTGPHLHFEIRLDGVTKVDSYLWLLANTN